MRYSSEIVSKAYYPKILYRKLKEINPQKPKPKIRDQSKRTYRKHLSFKTVDILFEEKQNS